LLCPPPHGIFWGRLDELLTSIASKKSRLDKLRPFSPQTLARLEHYYDVELTYTSNAIEGNTLSPVETTLVIEKGITVSGKPLKDHLETLDHYDAIRYVRDLARQTAPLTESDIRNRRRLVMRRSAPEVAGRYADLARYVRTETLQRRQRAYCTPTHEPDPDPRWLSAH
jgi:Fic family protein